MMATPTNAHNAQTQTETPRTNGTGTETGPTLPVDARWVERLSRARGEPDWLLRWRLERLHQAETLPMPGSRYTRIRGLKLHEIEPLALDSVSASVSASTPTPAPAAGLERALGERVERGRAEAAGVYALLDGSVVSCELEESLRRRGVLWLDVAQAIKEHPELVRRALEQLPEPRDRVTALGRALFTSGLFVYVPKGVEVERPLRAVYAMTRPGAGLFTQSALIVEEGSSVTLLEEHTSLETEPFERRAVHAGELAVVVGPGARASVAGVQGLNARLYQFIRRRARVQRDGQLAWALGWLGGRLTMSHVETVLDGPGAEVDDVQVFFTAGRQHVDLTSNLIHSKPHTRGEVNVKGVLKGQSQAVFWGLIRIDPGAQGANAFQAERSLLLERGPKSNAIPSLEILANDVRCTHAAATSPVDEEQLFYLRSRGLDEDEAKKLIVDGFFEPTIEKIPLPLVQTELRLLLDRKWQEEL